MSNSSPLQGRNEGVSAWQTLMRPPDEFAGIRTAAKARQAGQMRRVEKNLQIANKLDEAIRGRKTYEEVRELVRKSGAVCTIRKKQSVGSPLSNDDLRDINLSYRNQANLDMYTSTNMRKREENRRHADVVKAIEQFWKIMPKTENGNVNKSIYKWMSRKLFFTFVPKATEQEFERTVYEDWKNDACYSHLMNHRAFVNAIFALADVWCETVDPLEYRDFIDRCRKVVEAPPEYKGRRDEEHDDRGTAAVTERQRTGAPSPLNDSRRISLARISDDNDSAPRNTPPPVEGDTMESLRVAGEYLEDEILTLASIEAYKVLSTVSDLHSNVSEEAEDAISQAVRDLQDRRYEIFLDDKDESFGFEAELMQAARDQVNQRETRRATIAAEQALVTKQPLQDSADLDKWRAKRNDRQQAFEQCLVEHMNLIREGFLSDIARFKAARIRLSQLQKHLCVDLKNKLHPGFLVPRAQYDAMVKESTRACEVQCENDDDAFSEFIFLTRVLQLFQREGEHILRDTPVQAIYEEFFASEDPDISDVSKKPKFGNSRWKRGTEWVWELFRRRGELVDEIIEVSFDNVKRLSVRSTKAIHSIHRVEMELETAEIEMLVKDPLIPPKEKLGSLTTLQEQKQQSLAHRTEQGAALQNRVHQWEALLQSAQAQSQERLEAEKKLCASLDDVKSLEEAYQVIKPLLNLYTEQSFTGSRDVLEETMAPGAGPPSPKAASLTVAGLPAEVTGPVELLHYLTEQSAQCLTRWLTNFGVAVHGIFAEKRITFLELEEEHARRLGASYERALLTSGVELVAKLKDMLCDPKLTKEFTEAQLSEIQEMIAQEPYLQQLLKTVQTTKGFREDAMHRICKLESDRARLSSQRYVGVLGTQNTALLKLNELHAARILHEHQLIARFTDEWSDVEKQAKVAGALAAERRQKEAERMLREQQAAEERRKAAEAERLRRLAEDEKERKAAEAAKRKREQDILATRKKQLEDREKRERERQNAEEEVKKRWRLEFAEEQKRQKKEAEERRQLELQRVRASAKKTQPRPTAPAAKPLEPSEVAQPAILLSTPKEPPETSARKLVRRKSSMGPAYKPVEIESATQAAMLNTKKIKKAGAPSARIKEAIEAEVKAFGLLNSASLAINLESFAGRRTDYFVERASNAAIYAMECTRLRAPIVPAVSTLLSNDELNFTMTNLDVSGKPCNALTLLDVISLNPIQQLEMRKVKGFDKDACKKLCQVLLNHQFIQVLDLRNNDLGAHGGQSLLALTQSNPRIVRIKLQGCNVPTDIEADINKICDQHRFCNTIGRAEYTFIKSIFDEMDRDHSGEVDLAELRAYNFAHAGLIGTRSAVFDVLSPPASPNSSIEQSMQERQALRMDLVRDVLLQLDSEGTGNFTLAQLLGRIYPTWPPEEIERLIARYSDDSSDGASLKEMQQFIEAFGSNGTLTLHQLARGLGEADPESLRGAFQECDLDGDGVLSIDEFMSFVAA